MGRSPCCELRAHANKGAWSKEEDQRLVTYIRAHGEGRWRSLPKAAGLLRCGKSCRLRWINYLRPDLKRGNFTQEEDDIIIKLHSLLGNKWSLIARRLPGRTDNEIKNYWNTRIKRKLIKHGIDPQSHRPLKSSSSSAAATSAIYKYNPTDKIINSRLTIVCTPTAEDTKLHDSSSSRDDGSSRCNSTTTTTDESTPPPPPSNSGEALDLDLSIGLPSFSNYQKISLLVTFASEYN